MRVSVLVFEGTISLPAIGSLEILSKIGEMCDPNPFDIELLSLGELEVSSADALPVRCHRSIADVESTDLVIVPSLDADPTRHLPGVEAALPWLRRVYASGAELASICTGAFVLAEAGLLDGHRATTHWIAQELFARRYPRVELLPEPIIVDEGRIITSGGATSFLNLLIYLVEKYCGSDVALQASKMFLIDLGKGPQTAYAVFSTQKHHGDELVLQAQRAIEDGLDHGISIEELAATLAISRRSLERRFKAATGNTVLEYIQRLKIEAAKKLIESSNRSVSEVAADVGYADLPSFRRLFNRTTGMTPTEYRRRYFRPLPRVAGVVPQTASPVETSGGSSSVEVD